MAAVRVALAVLLAVALLAASLPAVERSADSRSAGALRQAATGIEAAATDLRLRDDAAPGVAGAMRRLAVRLPADGWLTSPVERAVLVGRACPVDGGDGLGGDAAGDERGTTTGAIGPGGRLVYRLAGGEPVNLTIHAPLCTPAGPVRFEAGRNRLTLVLVAGEGGDRAVVARRTGSRVTRAAASNGTSRPSDDRSDV